MPSEAFVAHDFRKALTGGEYHGRKYIPTSEPVKQYHGLYVCDLCHRGTYRASYRPLDGVYPCGLEGCAGEKWRVE